jgi:hypothetical protein
MVREVADHREDLKQASLTEGLSEGDAESRADLQLGDPLTLAEHLVTVLRNSSWWGRHKVITFFLLPLLTLPALGNMIQVVMLCMLWKWGYDINSQKAVHISGSEMAGLITFLHYAYFVKLGLVTFLFCWLARRFGVRFFWLVLACGICSLEDLMLQVSLIPHHLLLHLSLPDFHYGLFHPILQMAEAAIPLFIAAIIYTFQRQTLRNAHRQMATY